MVSARSFGNVAGVARPRKQSDDELIAAAARMIARRGPHDLTLAHVATEAGVSPATLVQRFGSKRQLLLAVAGSGPTGVADVFAAARARRRSPLAALEDAIGTMAVGLSDPDQVGNHLAFLALDLADPDFRERTAHHVQAMRAEIDALLKEAVAHGELELRARRPVAESLQAGYHGVLLMWAIEREGDPVARIREHVRLTLRPYRPR